MIWTMIFSPIGQQKSLCLIVRLRFCDFCCLLSFNLCFTDDEFSSDDDSSLQPNRNSKESKNDLLSMFFIHLLDNFCSNNTEVAKDKNVTQAKFFTILCTKLNELGVLRSLEFLQNVEEFKTTCSNAWKDFLRDVLHAKELNTVEQDTPRRLSSCSMPGLHDSSSGICNNRTMLTISLGDLCSSMNEEENSNKTSRYHSDFVEEEKLGQGGFGAVFKVTHTLDQLQYAVKKIKFRKVHSPAKLPRKILREVRCLARLEHSNVVRYFGAWMEYNVVPDSPVNSTRLAGCESDESSSFQSITEDTLTEGVLPSGIAYQGILYIQMQICSFSLKEWMDMKERIINSEENIAIVAQIAKALCYIHSQGLIHRDLKPSNVFVVGYDGSSSLRNACLKIGDFGVATFINDEVGDSFSRSPQLLSTTFPGNIRQTNFLSSSTPALSTSHTSPITIRNDGNGSPLQIVPPSPMKSLGRDQVAGVGSHSYRTTGIGTVAYASPEQLRKDIYDEKTDLYSLGIIFLELYFSFYTRMERAEILQKLRKNGSLPAAFMNQYPKEASIILQLTDPNPEARPSAQELLQNDIFTKTPRPECDNLVSILTQQIREKDEIIQQYEQKLKALSDAASAV